MFVLWIAGACLAISAILIFGIPLVVLGPRAVMRSMLRRPEQKLLAGSLVAIGASLFLASGSFIQTGNVDTLSAENFFSLYVQV